MISSSAVLTDCIRLLPLGLDCLPKAPRDAFISAFLKPSTKKQHSKDGSQQAITNELRNQYFHDVVLIVSADHIRGAENPHLAGDERNKSYYNFTLQFAPPRRCWGTLRVSLQPSSQ